MSTQMLRLAGLVIAAVAGLALGLSGIPDVVGPIAVLVCLVLGLGIGPTMFVQRTHRVSGRMAALFLGVNAPIAAYALLSSHELKSGTGQFAHDNDTLRVPLVHLVGGRDRPMESGAFETLDVVAGISLLAAFVWSVGLYAAVFYINKRTRGAATVTGFGVPPLGYSRPPSATQEFRDSGAGEHERPD